MRFMYFILNPFVLILPEIVFNSNYEMLVAGKLILELLIIPFHLNLKVCGHLKN